MEPIKYQGSADGHGHVLRALFLAKKEFGPLLRSKKGNFGKYVPLETVLESIEPAFEKHGLLLIQGVDNGQLVTEIWHPESGQSIIRGIPLVLEKDTPQGLGSALTYIRRYSLLTILNLAQEDDDGQRAEDERHPSAAMGQNFPKAAVDSKSQAKPTATFDPNKPLGFGKFKDKTAKQLGPKDATNYANWLRSNAEQMAKPLAGAAKGFVDWVAQQSHAQAPTEDICRRCGAPYDQCTCGT